MKSLDLRNNQIKELQGLGMLTRLEQLFLGGNQIDSDLIEKLGGLNRNGCAYKPQKFVEYCRRNK